MSISNLVIRAVQSARDATPTPTPAPSPGAQADVTLSNFYLAILLFVGSVVVISIALSFAFRYHAKLLKVIESAVKYNGQVVGSENSDIGVQSAEPEIEGPKQGTPSAKLEYSVRRIDPSLTITWAAENGDPASDTGPTFATRFDKAGSYKVTATYTDASNATRTLSKDVTVAVAAAAPAASIVLPFVIKNWGRLVVVIFGVGVISALMSTKILDAAAGIGILGTLLGVGAATATSGTSGDKPTTPPDD